MKFREDREVLVREANTEEGYIKLENGKIWYRAVGLDKEKTPVVCLHGGPGLPHEYLTPLELLSDERPVILYDQLGCGNSDIPDRPDLWNKDYFVGELEEMIDAFGLDDFFLFGQSWGSCLAVSYILDTKHEGLRGAIFGGPVMACRNFVDAMYRMLDTIPEETAAALRKGLETEDYESQEFLDACDVLATYSMCRLPEWPDYLITCFEKIGIGPYVDMWGPCDLVNSGNLKDFDVTGRLGEIDIPVFLVCGEFDACTPEDTADYHRAIKGSKMAVITGGAHLPHIDDPEKFIKVTREWLAEVD